jgi:hypothetical protein
MIPFAQSGGAITDPANQSDAENRLERQLTSVAPAAVESILQISKILQNELLQRFKLARTQVNEVTLNLPEGADTKRLVKNYALLLAATNLVSQNSISYCLLYLFDTRSKILNFTALQLSKSSNDLLMISVF